VYLRPSGPASDCRRILRQHGQVALRRRRRTRHFGDRWLVTGLAQLTVGHQRLLTAAGRSCRKQRPIRRGDHASTLKVKAGSLRRGRRRLRTRDSVGGVRPASAGSAPRAAANPRQLVAVRSGPPRRAPSAGQLRELDVVANAQTDPPVARLNHRPGRSPGANQCDSSFHRCSFRYTASTPPPSTSAELLNTRPSGPAHRSRRHQRVAAAASCASRQQLSVAAWAAARASCAEPNT